MGQGMAAAGLAAKLTKARNYLKKKKKELLFFFATGTNRQFTENPALMTKKHMARSQIPVMGETQIQRARRHVLASIGITNILKA